jgi:DNA-binding MarR family transcriptional regulator
MDAPTGWQLLAGKQSRTKIINALLSMPPHREFNKSELADFADVSRKSVHTHLPVLQELGIVKEVPNSSPQRYRFNTDSEIAELLIELDGAATNAGQHAGE